MRMARKRKFSDHLIGVKDVPEQQRLKGLLERLKNKMDLRTPKEALDRAHRLNEVTRQIFQILYSEGNDLSHAERMFVLSKALHEEISYSISQSRRQK